MEAEYGLTDRWLFFLGGLLKQPLDEALQGTEFELGAQFEMLKRHGQGFDVAFRAEYDFERNEPDVIVFGPIVKYVRGHASTTFNAFFTGEVGDDVNDALGFQYNWQAKYEVTRRAAIGVEAFGEIEDLSDPGSFDDQLHRLGPTFYLKLGGSGEESDAQERADEKPGHAQQAPVPEINLTGGVLFGLTDITSDLTFKLDAELEF